MRFKVVEYFRDLGKRQLVQYCSKQLNQDGVRVIDGGCLRVVDDEEQELDNLEDVWVEAVDD